ncbi:NmrA/HSCARG family protein [Frankia sp. QA3]|uniref:NmrA/HSCARG family protein n=1 Tax=Frankia sp. QA3 TaxID=710111 RepID=UPI000269CE4E|nr:NmrA/HSCARG family protein [Frankia sp. QA3]EIV96185.1 putative nucleoside-diphosphate sugar epimerase [Frankia sp. QA3]
MTEKIILVTGATGNQGGAAALRLLADGWRVRALTRAPAGPAATALAIAGAEIIAGGPADRAFLDGAVAGVHGVFSVQPSPLAPDPVTPQEEARWGRNVADAARAAGVEHLVYASVAGIERSRHLRAFQAKWQIEEHIREIGVPFTILRPASFMENYVNPAFGVQSGTLATALHPDTPEQLIALEDIGTFTALAFGEPDEHLGRTIALAGDELTPPQLAAALGQAVGREIPYTQIPVEAVRSQSSDSADALEFLNAGGGYGVSIPEARKLHPGLMDFDTWLDRHGRARLAGFFASGRLPAHGGEVLAASEQLDAGAG